jgi:hypothetical protein
MIWAIIKSLPLLSAWGREFSLVVARIMSPGHSARNASGRGIAAQCPRKSQVSPISGVAEMYATGYGAAGRKNHGSGGKVVKPSNMLIRGPPVYMPCSWSG